MDIETIKQAVAAVMPCTWTVHCEETPDKAAAKDELAFQIDKTDPFIGKIYHLVADGKCVATTGCGPNSEAHAKYLQVINPVAVAKLVGALETLQEENAELIIGISRLSEDEELLQETTDSDMVSVVKLAARLAEAEELARSYEAEANQLREASIANRKRALEAAIQIDYMRTTLQPFADSANDYDAPDENGPWPDIQDVVLSLGAARRAREALKVIEGDKSTPHTRSILAIDLGWKRDCQYLLDVLDSIGFEGRDLCEEDEAVIKLIRSDLTHPHSEERSFQDRVAEAHHALFDDDPTDIAERNARCFEEAIETAQAFGMTEEDALALVKYTFSRPVGDPKKELGAKVLTAFSLGVVAGIDVMGAVEAELEKLQRPDTIARIRAKRATRHGRGPLPGLDPTSPAKQED